MENSFSSIIGLRFTSEKLYNISYKLRCMCDNSIISSLTQDNLKFCPYCGVGMDVNKTLIEGIIRNCGGYYIRDHHLVWDIQGYVYAPIAVSRGGSLRLNIRKLEDDKKEIEKICRPFNIWHEDEFRLWTIIIA